MPPSLEASPQRPSQRPPQVVALAAAAAGSSEEDEPHEGDEVPDAPPGVMSYALDLLESMSGYSSSRASSVTSLRSRNTGESSGGGKGRSPLTLPL